jgi:predicted aconitase
MAMRSIQTNLALTDVERGILSGDAGDAAALAMRILARLAPLYGADHLLRITRAHIDGCIYTGDAGLGFAERLARMEGRVSVPTSLNVVSLDRARWRDLGMDRCYAQKADRLARAYLAMGAQPTFTCAPYQTVAAPVFGEQIAWSESNAVAFANSVIGARTNRYGDFLDICCALVGRVPASGLHLDEPRLGQMLIKLDDVPGALMTRDDFYPILGYLIGLHADVEVPVVEGLEHQPTEDQLKALSAAAATSGSVALFHLVGITPEAPTLADAFGGRLPRRVATINRHDLREARATLTTSRDDRLDVVAFGSPHCSLAECRTLASLFAGQRIAPGVDVFVTTSRAVRDMLEKTGDLATLEDAGARVTADTCIVVAPLVRPDARVLMTNSAKYAHYGPGLLNMEAVFGSTEDCVASAIAGGIVMDDGPWAR